MTRILTNFPFEAYAPREAFGAVEFVTYGDPAGQAVAGVTYPFDLHFDAARGSIHDLLAQVPGRAPDLYLMVWPDQDPIPADLEQCPIPTVAAISDYNLSLPWIAGLWPFFDVVLCDRSGVEVFQRLSFADPRYWCQYSFKTQFHHLRPDVERDLDVVLVGNLNPAVQRARVRWVQRLAALADHGIKVHITGGVQGEDYGILLNRAKIGFNHSIRSEMNLRAFEVPACGAVLMQEATNREVRDFLTPGEEVELYDDEDFEQKVLALLRDEPRREAMARKGHARIQQQSMPARIADLVELLKTPGPGRPTDASPADISLGRAMALLGSKARGPAVSRAFVAACDAAPADPRPLVGLAMALISLDPDGQLERALGFLGQALARDPHHVPALANLTWVLERAGRWAAAHEARGRLGAALILADDWRQVDGPVYPIHYSARSVSWATALQHAVRHGDPRLVGSHGDITAWA